MRLCACTHACEHGIRLYACVRLIYLYAQTLIRLYACICNKIVCMYLRHMHACTNTRTHTRHGCKLTHLTLYMRAHLRIHVCERESVCVYAQLLKFRCLGLYAYASRHLFFFISLSPCFQKRRPRGQLDTPHPSGRPVTKGRWQAR